MKNNFRSTCPITSSLDVLGDKWTLVIGKHMLLEHKETFKDFVESEEGIASNILSDRLKMLEALEVITKEKHPTNRKTNIYRLTEKGIALTPAIIEFALWSDEHLRMLNPDIILSDQLTQDTKTSFIHTNYILCSIHMQGMFFNLGGCGSYCWMWQ